MTRDSLSTYGVGGEAQPDHKRPVWPDGVVYHGSRLLLLVVLAGVITALFLPLGSATLGQYEVGEVLSESVIAEVDFTILKSPEDLSAQRAAAASGIPPTFNYTPEVGASMAVQLGMFFERLDSVALEGDSEMLRAHLGDESVVASPQQAILLMDEPTRRRLETISVSGVLEYAEIGVIDFNDEAQLNHQSVRIQDPGADDRRTMSSAEVLTGEELVARIVRDLNELETTSTELSDLLRLIVIKHTAYSLAFDAEVTGSERDASRQTVPTSIGNVVQQEAVVRSNERPTAGHLARVRA